MTTSEYNGMVRVGVAFMADPLEKDYEYYNIPASMLQELLNIKAKELTVRISDDYSATIYHFSVVKDWMSGKYVRNVSEGYATMSVKMALHSKFYVDTIYNSVVITVLTAGLSMSTVGKVDYRPVDGKEVIDDSDKLSEAIEGVYRARDIIDSE